LPDRVGQIALPRRSGPSAIGQRGRFLVVVKTYPSPSTKYGETVCCAGIDAETGGWIRMFPVNFRSLAEFARFKKWQFVDASWEPAKDGRPESRHIHQDSLRAGEAIPAGPSGWRIRRRWLDPLLDQSIHSLEAERRATGKSLGVIRPATIKRLLIRDAETWDERSETDLVQLSLTWTMSAQPRGDLEKLPFDFLYEFTCRDAECQGHTMKVLDWEMAQTFRNFRRLYGPSGWEPKLREKYGQWVPHRDVHLVMGTHHVFGNWMIVGVLYPPPGKVDESDRRRGRKNIGQEGTMTLPGFGLETE
jgi:hypothetical protein